MLMFPEQKGLKNVQKKEKDAKLQVPFSEISQELSNKGKKCYERGPYIYQRAISSFWFAFHSQQGKEKLSILTLHNTYYIKT